MAAIEATPNFGKVLGGRLRHVGIDTREKLEKSDDAGIRWNDLPNAQAEATRGLSR